MRIETRAESELPLVALLDEAETRVVSRTLDPVLRWMSDRPHCARGHLARGEGEGLVAAFADEGTLMAFMGRFLPGKLPLADGGAA